MFLRGTIAAVALALWGAPAHADARSEAMLRAFVESMNAADWTSSAATIRSEGSDTIAEGLTVTRREPDFSIGIERIRVRDLSEHPEGGGFQATEIEVTGGSMIGGDLEYRLPSAMLDDIAMPSFAGITVDTKRLVTTFSKYYSIATRGRLASFSAPDLIATAKMKGPDGASLGEMRMSYGSMRLTGFRDGIIESQEFGPSTVDVTNPDGSKVKFVVDRMTAGRMDLGAGARILDETQYRDGRGDGVWRPIVSQISYSGISGSGPDGVTFHVKEIAVENMDGRQPEKPFTSDLDRLADPEISAEAKEEVALEAVLNAYSAWRVGTIRVDDIGVEAPAQGGEFALGSMTTTGLSSDGIDSFILKGLRAKSPEGFGSLESFEFAGFTFPNVRALMQFAALEADVTAEKHAETMRAMFAALPRLAHFGMQGLVAGMTETETVTLANFTIDLSDWNEIYAGATDIRLENLEIPRSLAKLDPQTEQMMDSLGYATLVLGMTAADRWLPGPGTDDATWRFSVKDAGDIELSYSLTGITVDWMLEATAAAAKAADSEAALDAMLNQLGLKSATLKVTDRSLLDRGFGLAAKMQNLTIEGPAYREQMRGALPFLLSAAVPADITKLLSKPLQEFMAGGQTLVAEIAPATPIPLGELAKASEGDPMALPSKLGLQVRSEAPGQ